MPAAVPKNAENKEDSKYLINKSKHNVESNKYVHWLDLNKIQLLSSTCKVGSLRNERRFFFNIWKIFFYGWGFKLEMQGIRYGYWMFEIKFYVDT